MTPEQWARVKGLFHAALERPAEARRAWLAEASAGDEAVRREAEALLASHETATSFLETAPSLDTLDEETLAPGARVGPYEVVGEIGRGGMGVVYLAEDTRLGRPVALKSVPFAAGAAEELRKRLRREARAAATIAHPAVATVFALEEIDGRLFIASEYVPGGTLRAAIERGPLEPPRAAAIALDIARALRAAHERGVVHRDLKPENVLLTPEDAVKVVDFGIALVSGPAATRLTRSGARLGTPAYMAPEQLLGGTVDARADIYSLGVMLHEMVTGRHPLAPDPIDRQADTRSGAPLLRIAARCMAADPGGRYRSARELLEALEGGAAREPEVPDAARPPALWWWEFHQAMTALAYWVTTIPAWRARELIGGTWGRVFFILLLAAVIVAANLRLHLWFTSRFYPAELGWARRRVRRWIASADWGLAATLVSGGILIGEEHSSLAFSLIAIGIGAAVAFLMIEPVTARAAFRGGQTLPPR